MFWFVDVNLICVCVCVCMWRCSFQEIVPLKASNVFGSENRKICSKWNSMIREALKKKVKQNFKCIISKQMVGIMISIWVRSDLHPFIRSPSVSCIGCGIMSCLGNKV